MPRHNRIVRKTLPNRSWAGVEVGVTIAGNTSVLIGTFALSNSGIDEIILRTIGSFVIRLDQIAVTEVQIGALGLIVVSDAAIAAGVASIPKSVTDIDNDGWFAFMPIASAQIFGDATGMHQADQYHIDSKAKRVTHDGYGIALVVENSTAAGFQIDGVMRLLS